MFHGRIEAMNLSSTVVIGLTLLLAPQAAAHFPHHENRPVRQHVEPIPSIGANLPSHRERYNRPRYLGGKIAYYIAPSSQEAMSWHRSVHRGYYANHAPRMEDRYIYAKPWQALMVGPRTPRDAQTSSADNTADSSETDSQDDVLELSKPIGTDETSEELPIPR